jgi:hypothetical protein
MNDINKLSNSLEKTLKDSDLHSFTEGVGEVALDSLLEEGVLKDLPIIGMISGLTKTALNIQDQLFLKKIIRFLTELRNTDYKERNRLITKIDKSEEFEIKVGEKLLYIIDKCDDHISSVYVAKLFRAFLNGEIDYSEFLRGATIIQNIFEEDLKFFLNSKVEELEKEIKAIDPIPDMENNLVNSELCAMITDEVRVEDQWDHEMPDKYIVEGGNTIIYLTDFGHKIKQLLG